MFGETTEEEKKKKKKWFQSLSLISSEESDDDDNPTYNIMLIEVQNANLRFPYPMFSEASDEEFETCTSNNGVISQVDQRKRTFDCHFGNSPSSENNHNTSSYKNNIGHAGNFGNVQNHKQILPKNQKTKSKCKVIRDELKRVWNYTKKRKKQHLFRRPGTILSTSEDESEPIKKKHKKIHRRKLVQLKPSSSEENSNENMDAHKSELKDISYTGRSFSKFIDSNSNSETSESKENKLTNISMKSLSNSVHNLSSSNNNSDSEPAGSSNLSRVRKAENKKRVDHFISSSEEETKKMVLLTNKTNMKSCPSAKKITYIPSKHPFRNLITAQQLKEDNHKMKIGLKPSSQKADQCTEASTIEMQSQPPKKVDNTLKKKIAARQLKTDGSKMHSSHNSKLQNLKKRFISSNKSSVELSKQIRSNMNSNTKGSIILNPNTIGHKNKPIKRFSNNHQTLEGRSNSISEETARCFSNNGEEIKQNEAKYTVNVNVYCNSNQLDASKSVQEAPEDHSSNDSIGKESSHSLDINLSVIQEEEETKSTHKKVRISHNNQSKNKLENKPYILCESNSESKINKNNLLNRGSQRMQTSTGNTPGQFDIVGNIISQMKTNTYPSQKGRRKSLEQGTDALGWFSNLSPPLPNTQTLPIISNSECDPNKGPAQQSLPHQSAASRSSLISDPLYQQSLKPSSTYPEKHVKINSKRQLYTNKNENDSLLSTKTDKGAHPVIPLAIPNKQYSNEVIIPFYSANNNDYVTRSETPQTNIGKRKSGLDSENLELCSVASKESFRSRDSESGSTITYIDDNKNRCTSELDTTYQTQRNNGKNTVNRDSNNVKNSLQQTTPIIPHCLNIDTLNQNTTSENSNPQKHPNAFDSEQSASKKGIRIRIQGNEFLYQKKTNSNSSSLNSLSKTLTTGKLVSLSNSMKQNDLSLYNQDICSPSVEKARRDALPPESSVATIVGNEEIEKSSFCSKENQNVSSGDSDEDSSSSDESSSSSSSSDSKHKTGGSNTSDSSSSSSKLKITEQEEETDHTVEASSCAQKEISDVDIEVIILDSSSDEELPPSCNVLMSQTVNVERPENCHTVKNKVDCVQPQTNKFGSGSVKSLFDPVEDGEPPINVESQIHDASIPAIAKICMETTTNDHSIPSSSNSFVGKIRVKSLKELGVVSEVLQPENALQHISEHNHDAQLQTNTLPSTTIGTVGNKITEEKVVDVDQSKVREPLRIKLSKVTAAHKKSLYKVQSVINTPKSVGESQTNMLKNQEKSINLNILDNTSNSNKLHYNNNASKLPSSLSKSLEPTSLQKTTAKNAMETHDKVLHKPLVSKTLNPANLLCVKTGENSYRFVQQESNKSNTGKLTNSLVSNVPSALQNSQLKKPIPTLIALQSTPVVFIPVASTVQAKSQIEPMRIIQPPLVSSADSNGSRSALSLDDGQSSAYNGMTIISKTQEKLPEDTSVSLTNVTNTMVNSKQTLDQCQPLKNNPQQNNSTDIEELFFKICDDLFTEVICLKIPKMVDDLHLTIVHDEFKEERLKKTEQLLSRETILSEKNRAERDFNEQIRIRAHSFVPLFTTVVNKFKKYNFKTLVIALYVRFINQLQAIDYKYAKYRLSLRHIIKAMLQKFGSTSNDVCQIFSENDSSFRENYLFIENLLRKYDLYVEQRRIQKQINIQQVSSTETDTNKRTEELGIQKSKENSTQQTENPTKKVSTTCTINGSFSCCTPNPAKQNPQQISSSLPENVPNPVHTEPTSFNISESTQQKNLDDIMFDAFFKTITPNLNPSNQNIGSCGEGHSQA